MKESVFYKSRGVDLIWDCGSSGVETPLGWRFHDTLHDPRSMTLTPPRHPFFSKKAFRLSNDQLTALHAKLDSLIQEVTEIGETNANSAEDQFELTLVFYKQPEKGEGK